MGEVAVLGYRREPEAPVVPLLINMELCVTDDVVRGNLKASLARPYKRFNEYLDRHSGAVSIVGSGPSLKRTWRDLQGDVLACNAALDFLLDRGVVPKYAMFMDADPIMASFAVAHPEVTYLVASRCHPSVFERLEGCDVVTWHAKCDQALDEYLVDRVEPMIHGGSAAVTRAMCVAHAMGYREQHFFGADSSSEDGNTHIRKSLASEQELRVWVAGEWFDTTPWLAAQVEDFKVLAPALIGEGASFVIHGNGLLPHVARVMGIEVRDSQILEET